MPTIILKPDTKKMEPALRTKAYAFLEKLGKDDTTAGLHIEKMHNAADARARTGRVDLANRAVIFKVKGGDDAHYVYIGTWLHDEAIEVARTRILTINPVNGVAELVIASTPTGSDAGKAPRHLAPPFIAEPSGPVAPVIQPGPLEGHNVQELVESLGIELSLATDAVAANDTELNALIDAAVKWQGLALLDLAVGTPIHEVKAKLGLGEYTPDTAATADDELLRALKHPAAQMEFAFIEDNDELRQVIEGGDFGAWRTFLHPEQRKYATKHFNGAFRLSGGAGTGKTVVVLHRAHHLTTSEPESRTIITTFTTNLADALRTDILRLDPATPLAPTLGTSGVWISTVDAVASAVLKDAGATIADSVERILGVRTTDIGSRSSGELWTEAIDVAGRELPQDLKNKAFFEGEYVAIVLANGITDKDGYFSVRRAGRGVALDRGKRGHVWAVIEAYRRIARMNASIDYHEANVIAADHLRAASAATGQFQADHVLIDEGQDLTAAHWLLLRALVGEGANDLFIAEDSHQRIYGQRVALSKFGIKIVGRSQRLTLNYRTTAQNLAYAISLLSGIHFVDLEEGQEKASDYRSARSGPEPTLRPYTSLAEELDGAATIVAGWLETGGEPESIGILVRDRGQRDRVVSGLAERGVTVRALDSGKATTGYPQALTMHRAKGMEFARVLLFGLGDKTLPNIHLLKQLAEAERPDALLRERSLLYVAATRARDELVVSWSGEPSALLGTTPPR
ncbi:DNA helicase UvrD [Cryobacterium levicorallinum]|uniref:DNA 3'-5' helicase n=1 Tax=Cryobacterium levicorallinum TaxID=995038 RepID=A0A1I3CP18_9MICO|nr:UvrD-helicase domain-containing protein [Cryobacterium levicorallinum]TFB87870.1 DNA helicase UvrD [Cryobacterium levicorallinum]GEP27811.1 DNA helicase [Cryobacterium levicorallinum]SFH76252.1 UvrD/REP helicase N-terminal domain-containing protein [Cryobacterium levicorallinum]